MLFRLFYLINNNYYYINIFRQDMDLQGILEVFFENPSDDEHEYFPPERERHNKIPYYFENIVLTYNLTGKISKKGRNKKEREFCCIAYLILGLYYIN